MAKSLRSKIKRRFRTLKRKHIEHIKEKPELEILSQRQRAIAAGLEYRTADKTNAFLNPKDPNAIFPKYKPQTIIDFRNSSIPNAGKEFSGAYRKKKNLAITENEPFTIEEIIEEENNNNIQETEEDNVQLDKLLGKIKIGNKKKEKVSKEVKEERKREMMKIIQAKNQLKKKRNKKTLVF